MNWNHLDNYQEYHIRDITVKFGQNPSISLGGMSFEAIANDAWAITHDSWRTYNDHKKQVIYFLPS